MVSIQLYKVYMLQTHQETMPRFRSRNMLRPVNRIKHVVDVQFGITAGAIQAQTLVKAVDAPVLANTSEVVTGSTVNGIYIKLEAYATSSGALANFYMIVYKNPGLNLTDPNPNVIGSADEKKFVIHQEMVMFQKVTPSNPRTVFNGVIVIPKGYRRFGPKDELRMVVLAPGVSADVCVQAHYKEFR